MNEFKELLRQEAQKIEDECRERQAEAERIQRLKEQAFEPIQQVLELAGRYLGNDLSVLGSLSDDGFRVTLRSGRFFEACGNGELYMGFVGEAGRQCVTRESALRFLAQTLVKYLPKEAYEDESE